MLDDIRQALAQGVRPTPSIWFDEWADANVMLRRGTVAIPWRTSKTPYLREIMRCLSMQSPVRRVVVQKSVQLGVSEMANAFCAYVISQCPMPIIFVQPDILAAKEYSRERLQPVLEDCKAIDGKIAEVKSRDAGNTVNDKSYLGGPLKIIGSNSPSGFASMPAGVILFDEADRAKASAGKEGDQWELALNRLITFPRSKAALWSTPGLASTSRVEPEYLASDRREYLTPCPLCDVGIELDFDRMVWPEDPRHDPLHRCQACNDVFDESAKPYMLEHGVWVPRAPEVETAGFRLNGLQSMLTWRDIDDRRRRAIGKLNKLIVYTNNIQGRTFDLHAATKVDPTKLAILSTPIEREGTQSIVPDDVMLLTAGVDVQAAGRLEAVLYGWGRGDECWHLERGIFRGDITEAAVWADLDFWLRSIWHTTAGRQLRLAGTCIDYRGGASKRVSDFVRNAAGKRVWAILGASGDRELWPSGKPAKSRYGARLYRIGIDVAKQQIHATLRASVAAREAAQLNRTEVRGPGKVHIAEHLAADADYLAGLVSEAPITTYAKNRPIVTWEPVPNHAPVEPFDCAVYGMAALAAARLAGRARGLDAASKLPLTASQPPETNSLTVVKPQRREEIRNSTPPPRPQAATPPMKRPRIVDPFADM